MKNFRSDKCKKGGFESFWLFLLLAKACSNGWSILGHVCENLRGSSFLGHILFHIGALHPMLGLSSGFSWRYVGSDWGRGGWIRAMLKALLL